MTKLTLIALAAAAVVGAVLGIHYYRPKDNGGGTAAPRDDSPPLHFEPARDVMTTELGFEGERAFAFDNLRDNPLTVGVVFKECQCSRIQICLIPEDWERLDPQERQKRAGDPALKWDTLEQDSHGFTVPARAGGLLRLTWKGKEAGDHRFAARFWIDDDGRRLNQTVEAPVHVVPPVYIRAENNRRRAQADVGEMIDGEERTAWFLCYSLTRPSFKLTPAPPLADACLTYEAPEPLSERELKALEEQAGSSVRSGCRVAVKVHEKVGDIARLDLGPLRRIVVWNTDVAQGQQVSGIITGSVAGEVRLTGTKAKAFVDLGNVSPGKTAPIEFTLESTDPLIELSLDEKHTLDILTVELVDGKAGKESDNKKTWRVQVEFQKDSAFRGKFPTQNRAGYDNDVSCSAVFQISRRNARGDAPAKPVRRLYVPVHGVVPP
jgi:hypothetical protein